MQLRAGGSSHTFLSALASLATPCWTQPMDPLQLRAGEHLTKIQETCSQAGWHQHCPLSEPPSEQHHGHLIHPLPLGFTPQGCIEHQSPWSLSLSGKAQPS